MLRTKPAILKNLFLIILVFLSTSLLGAETGAQQEGVVFAINCGGSEYTDKNGVAYKSDTHFSGGLTYKTAATILGTEDGPLYQTERWGTFSYKIPLANGDYRLTLKFAEIYEYARWAGARVFNVKVQGQKAINSLDLFRKVGQYRAYDITLPVTTKNGVLTVEFYNETNSAKVNAILVSKEVVPEKGKVKGKVVAASSKLPIAEATVTVLDSSNTPKSSFTNEDGRYEIGEIIPGDIRGEMTKEGYAPYFFQGTLPPGETKVIDGELSPILPLIKNVEVSDITINSVKITWETDQEADSLVEYGETSSYGKSEGKLALIKNHEILLKNLDSGKAYHYRLTSKNSYGFASSSADNQFSTRAILNPVQLRITHPQEGSNIRNSTIRVEGKVENSLNLETGVSVNGLPATVFGDRFVVNQVPLVKGDNLIKAVAIDVEGNQAEESLNIRGVVSLGSLRIATNVDSGLSPLEARLKLDSNLGMQNVSIISSGPGEVEWLEQADGEYRLRVKVEGVYIFTARVPDASGFILEDSVAITVLSREEVTPLLGAKWADMKEAMANQDIKGALTYFSERSREIYRIQLNALKPLLSEIVSEFNNAEIHLKMVERERAEFEILVIREGAPLSFSLKFIKDSRGIWKIWRF